MIAWRTQSRWLPLTPTVVAFLALMLLGQAAADIAAIEADDWANTAYWISATAMVLVVFAAQLFAHPSPRERLAMIVALGLALYLVKILAFPIHFTYYDELSHTRTALDILRTDHLFHTNSLLRISPHFPGLEILTTALMHVLGISLFASGALIVGIGRVILVAAAYGLFLEASKSHRVAGIASVLYMANPSFLYFNAGFAYESLALPMAVTVVALTLCWMRSSPGGTSRKLLLCLLILISAIVVTHHFTSYLVAAALLLLCICAFAVRRWGEPSRPPWHLAAYSIFAAVLWVILAASELIRYARLIFQPAFESFIEVVAGSENPHAAFSGATAPEATSPTWLKLAAFASIAIIVSSLPFGAVLAWRRKGNAGALFLLILALTYPVIQVFRFAGAAIEAANRSSSTIYLGLSFIVGLVLVYLYEHRALPPLRFGRHELVIKLPDLKGFSRRLTPVGLIAAMAILFTGGVIIFWPPYGRLPGPYQTGSDIRGISQQGIDATRWLRRHLGAGHVVLADRTSGQLVGVYGLQQIAAGSVGEASIGRVFETPTLDRVTRLILRDKKVQFIIVDKRLATGLPIRGYYVDQNEISERSYAHPLPLKNLLKFADKPGISLIYNNGPMQIYDVRRFPSEQ